MLQTCLASGRTNSVHPATARWRSSATGGARDRPAAVHQQRGDLDTDQDVANVLGRHPGYGAEAGAVEGPHGGAELVDA
jgi:hypothetical protein